MRKKKKDIDEKENKNKSPSTRLKKLCRLRSQNEQVVTVKTAALNEVFEGDDSLSHARLVVWFADRR